MTFNPLKCIKREITEVTYLAHMHGYNIAYTCLNNDCASTAHASKVAPRIVYPSTDCAHAHVHTHMQNDLQRYYQPLPRRVSGEGVYGSDILAA